MTKYLLMITMLLPVVGCMTQQARYSVVITNLDATYDTIALTASSDSAAFISGLRTYWAKKAAAMESNKRFSSLTIPPLTFSVYGPDGILDISEPDKERLAGPTVSYYRDSILPGIEALLPAIEDTTIKTADIY